MKTKQRPAGRKLRRLEVALMIGLAAALAWGAWSLGTQRQLADRVVRLHVLANSDSEADQALKLTVRDRILEVAEPLLEDSADRDAARTALESALPQLEQALGCRVVVIPSDGAGCCRAYLGTRILKPRRTQPAPLPGKET